MTQRRQNLGGLFDETPDVQNVEEMDEITYGKLQQVNQQRMVVEARPIKDIYPDLKQPRRAIPTAVRLACRLDPENMQSCWAKWIKMAEKESNTELRIQEWIDWLVNEDDVNHLPEDLPAEYVITKALRAVVQLAASIKRDGLINAISVCRYGRRFRIVTGERRWLAFQLLHHVYGDWALIPSYESDPDVWLQAVENTNREDLTGIALARQFALLLMDLYPEAGWGTVEYYTNDDGSDRIYYAQVSDGSKWRIPRGEGQRLADAMGVGYSTLRKLRSILSVPDAIWVQADDEGWSTHAILDWIADDNKRYTVPTGTVSPKNEPPTSEPQTITPASSWRTEARDEVDEETGEVHLSPALPASETPLPTGHHPKHGENVAPVPQGTSIKPIDPGQGVVNDQNAAIMRKYAIEGPAVDMWQAVDRMMETRNLEILSLLDDEQRDSVRKQLFLGITQGLRLFAQMVPMDTLRWQLDRQMDMVYEMGDGIDAIVNEINEYAETPDVEFEVDEVIDERGELLPDVIVDALIEQDVDALEWHWTDDFRAWDVKVVTVQDGSVNPVKVLNSRAVAMSDYDGIKHVAAYDVGLRKLDLPVDGMSAPHEIGGWLRIHLQ